MIYFFFGQALHVRAVFFFWVTHFMAIYDGSEMKKEEEEKKAFGDRLRIRESNFTIFGAHELRKKKKVIKAVT